MEYYHIRLRENTSNLCMIILPGGEILLQASTNGSCQLTRHFTAENEWFISWIRIHLFVNILNSDLNKSRLDRSCAESGINS